MGKISSSRNLAQSPTFEPYSQERMIEPVVSNHRTYKVVESEKEDGEAVDEYQY